jgi:hypothetical protein
MKEMVRGMVGEIEKGPLEATCSVRSNLDHDLNEINESH